MLLPPVWAALAAIAPLCELSAEPQPPFLESWEADGRLNLVRIVDAEAAGWLYFHPIYRDIYEVGSDVGGDRNEFRDQNRARQLSRRGADLAVYNASWTGGLRATSRSINDYHYYRRNSDRWDSSIALGEAFAYLRWNPGGGESADPAPDGSALLPASIRSGERADSIAQLRPEHRPLPGLVLQGGRTALRSDPEGLLFVGESPGGRLIYTGERSGRGGGLRVGVAGQVVDREVRAIGRPDHPAALYMGTLGWLGESWNLGALYGFYRSPGRAAESDLYLPGFPPTRVALPTGQSALPDFDVHYYGLRYEHDWNTVSYTLSGFYNAGRSIAVDAAGTRVGSSRKSIRGALVYGEVVYHFDSEAGQASPGCVPVRPAANSCVRSRPLIRGPELALAGLFGSRDANDGDDKHRGFGALRPVPSVLGGAASIFVSGPPVDREHPPLANTQPGVVFADGGLPDTRGRYPDGLQPDGFGRARDNVDPTPPEYDNEGLSMASLRFSFAPFGGKAEAITFDLFTNYAAFRTGSGWEGIAAARVPLEFVDARFALELSATGASYRSNEDEPDPVTGQDRRPGRKYYSRYRLGFSLAL
ncbi:MAG: hypothetical protein NXI24_22315 [bacterium]|nr:hypothetical protein [bacterium]